MKTHDSTCKMVAFSDSQHGGRNQNGTPFHVPFIVRSIHVFKSYLLLLKQLFSSNYTDQIHYFCMNAWIDHRWAFIDLF